MKSYENYKSNLESYNNDIRRAASSIIRIESSSKDNSIKNLRDSILQSSDEMSVYILNRSAKNAAHSPVKHPRLTRLLRLFS